LSLLSVLQAAAVAVPWALGDRMAVMAFHWQQWRSLGFGGLLAGWSLTVAVVVLRDAASSSAAPDARDAQALRAWANERLGKTQRLAALRFADELPRSAIGKVLRRELRARWLGTDGSERYFPA